MMFFLYILPANIIFLNLCISRQSVFLFAYIGQCMNQCFFPSQKNDETNSRVQFYTTQTSLSDIPFPCQSIYCIQRNQNTPYSKYQFEPMDILNLKDPLVNLQVLVRGMPPGQCTQY